MGTIFIIGTVWFYILLLTAIVLVILALENDYYWRATLVVIGTFMALHFFGSSQELRTLGSYIWHNPGTSIGIFAAYLLIGTVWSLLSWKRFLIGKRREYQERNSKMSANDAEGLVMKNKHKIITWMVYWPFSMLWSLLRDPFQEIYERLSGTFKKMALSSLSDVIDKKD